MDITMIGILPAGAGHSMTPDRRTDCAKPNRAPDRWGCCGRKCLEHVPERARTGVKWSDQYPLAVPPLGEVWKRFPRRRSHGIWPGIGRAC